MAELPLPHLHVSGINTIVMFLALVVMFGSLHLLAAAHPSNRLASAWLSLNF